MGQKKETPGEIYLNDTLPVAPDRQRLLGTLLVPKLMDYEEMPGIKVTPTRKKTIKEQQEKKRKKKAKLVVKEYRLDTTTKK